MESRRPLGPIHSRVRPVGRAWLLTATLALPGLTAAPDAHATALAPESAQASEEFLQQGDAAQARGDYHNAISSYREAYYALPLPEQAGYLGSLPVRNAMEAYDLLRRERDERSILDEQIAFLTEFLDAVARNENARPLDPEILAELEQLQASLRTQREQWDVAEQTDTPSELMTDPEQESGPQSDADEPPADEERKERDRLGLGLIVAGGLTTVVGAGVMAGWWTIRDQAVRFADAEPGYEVGTVDREQYLAGEEARARDFLVAGAVVAGVGGVVVIGGTIRLLLSRRERASVTSYPILGPRLVGLGVTAWF